MNYISGSKGKRAEVHKNMQTGSFEVRHYHGDKHVNTLSNFDDSGKAHIAAKSFVNEGAMEDALKAITASNKKRLEDFKSGKMEADRLKDPKYAKFKANLEKSEKTYQEFKKKFYKEDAAVNSAGSAGVAGIGVGPQGEPGVKKNRKSPVIMRMLRRKNLREDVDGSHPLHTNSDDHIVNHLCDQFKGTNEGYTSHHTYPYIAKTARFHLRDHDNIKSHLEKHGFKKSEENPSLYQHIKNKGTRILVQHHNNQWGKHVRVKILTPGITNKIHVG